MNAATRWGLGGVLGTALFLSLSPIFTRSYLPNAIHRGRVTLPPGHLYRWRSEGYADTAIGPYGMPGRTAVTAPRDQTDDCTRVALWGDSQTEGVAVPDRDKLFAAMMRASAGRLDVYPLAISGDALGDWIAGMRWAERTLAIDRHAILICQTDDLLDLSPPPPPTPGRLGGLTARLPAAVVQAARHALTNPNGSPRRWRFAVGPPAPTPTLISRPRRPELDESLAKLRGASNLPIDLIYAPLAPQIIQGRIQTLAPDAALAAQAQRSARKHHLGWIDTTAALAHQFQTGPAPHGFHNGHPASGHLNRHGYRAIAQTYAAPKITPTPPVERALLPVVPTDTAPSPIASADNPIMPSPK